MAAFTSGKRIQERELQDRLPKRQHNPSQQRFIFRHYDLSKSMLNN
jgi:hypothetical protein